MSTQSTIHVVYANDLICAGNVQNFAIRWHKINKLGPKIGYFPKRNKSWLSVKPEQYDTTGDMFKETTLNVTKKTETTWRSCRK